MPVLPFECFQVPEMLFPRIPRKDAPSEADFVKLSDLDLRQQIMFLGKTHSIHRCPQPAILRPLDGHTAVAILFPVVQQGSAEIMTTLFPGFPHEPQPIELPDISAVESPLPLALPYLVQPIQKVSICNSTGGDEIAVPMSFLESRDGGHKFIQVPAMKSAVQQGPRESQFIQSADRFPVECALSLRRALFIHPVGELSVQRVTPRHIAMPLLLLERHEFVEALFPSIVRIETPSEAERREEINPFLR